MTAMTKDDWQYILSTQSLEFKNENNGLKQDFKERMLLSKTLGNISLLVPKDNQETLDAITEAIHYVDSFTGFSKKNLAPFVEKICETLDGKYNIIDITPHLVNKFNSFSEKMMSASHMASCFGYLSLREPQFENTINEIFNTSRKNYFYENLAWVDINNQKKQQKKNKNIELPDWIKNNNLFYLPFEEVGLAKAKKFLKFLNYVKEEDLQTFFNSNRGYLAHNSHFLAYLKTDENLNEEFNKNTEKKENNTSFSFNKTLTITEVAKTHLAILFENLPSNIDTKQRKLFKDVFFAYAQSELNLVSFSEINDSIYIKISRNLQDTDKVSEEIKLSMEEDMKKITEIFNDFKNYVATAPKMEKWISSTANLNEIKEYIEIAKSNKNIKEVIQNSIKADNDDSIKSNSFKL